MKRGYLSQYFESVVAKRLSAVEADLDSSNQHEWNGTKELKLLLGKGTGEKVSFPTKFIWLGNENEGVSSEGSVTWYDARLKKRPKRSEYRLYFQTSDVSKLTKEGDYIFIAKRTDGSLLAIIAASGSTAENQLFWLFDIDRPSGLKYGFSPIDDDTDTEVDFATRFILDELGIEVEEPEADKLDVLLERFEGVFPSTEIFSSFARSTVTNVDPLNDPDSTLMAWMEQEEKLFRRLERHQVADRLKDGFMSNGVADVDGFLYYSKSVQNRRKSRAGFAFENHVKALFKIHGISFSQGAITENKSKPDYLFPGATQYHDESFPEARLTMLGLKTSLKERWRQIEAEAKRINPKHLLTLEPGISIHQTNEMQSHGVQLVIPQSLHSSYTPEQQGWLMSLKEFIELVKSRESDGDTNLT